MTRLSDDAIARLRHIATQPDFENTRYRIGRQIGRGGMGVVYEADDVVLQRRVAVKILAPELMSTADAARLSREARIVAHLEHPGIVPIYEVGQLGDGRTYYAMKLVRGTRLDEYTRHQPTLVEQLRLFVRICEPVAFAHANGFVHRDLKPENVMVGEFGAVLVMDWGLASAIGERDPAGLVVGTPGFMAPEQSRGDIHVVNPATDVYALGAILTFLLRSSRHPLPRALDAIANKCLSSEKRERYATARELADDVTRFLDAAPLVAYQENVFERAFRWLSRNRVLVAIVAAYLAMRVIVFFWLRR